MTLIDDRLRFYKDPLDTITYTLDWEPKIGLRTIVSSAWSTNPGLTILANSFTMTNATVLVNGGTVGSTVKLYNSVTLSDGQIYTRIVDIVLQNRLEYLLQYTSEKVKYTIDWSEIDVDITAHTWLTASGLTYSDATFTEKLASVTVNGGTAGTVYPLRHRITTVGGQILHKGYALRFL